MHLISKSTSDSQSKTESSRHSLSPSQSQSDATDSSHDDANAEKQQQNVTPVTSKINYKASKNQISTPVLIENHKTTKFRSKDDVHNEQSSSLMSSKAAAESSASHALKNKVDHHEHGHQDEPRYASAFDKHDTSSVQSSAASTPK